MTVGPSPLLPPLMQPVSELPGVGPERQASLLRLGIRTIEDLLLHRPHRYEDRRQFRQICDLVEGESVTVRGKVIERGVKWFRRHSKSIFELVLDDGTGRLHCRWWNAPYLERQFPLWSEWVAYGRVAGTKPRAMDHPETEMLEKGEQMQRITPIYPLTEGLTQRWLRNLIGETLRHFRDSIPDPFSAGATKPFPEPLREILGLSRAAALQRLHCPENEADIELARRRLAFDEFMALQLRLRKRRRNFEARAQGLPCGGDNRLVRPLLSSLGFKLTRAQTSVLKDIRQDMSGAYPMRRLLQGDVGSGKTLVAACAALMTIESGYTSALMVPTEILAQQHYRNFKKWFEPLGVAVHLHTGSHKTSVLTPDAPNQLIPATPAIGTMFVGTHALLNEGFAPERLGLVIIDEQHKFGVAQRERLVRKGSYPHLLVMTATPIPRTLGLTLYGELDLSVLDELPAGRQPVKTFVRGRESLPKVWQFIKEKLAEGRQAFVVYPRVEETQNGEVKAVKQEFARVSEAVAPFRAELLHGSLAPEVKETTMREFRAGRVHVLLATSLIEVGVDVPNATVMLIENASQFGLAQLHQLRGRIGRGQHGSYCILIAEDEAPDERERLEVLATVSDGFKLAEADLKFRGPGEFLGHRQSGLPQFRFGDLNCDLELIRFARDLAKEETTGN